MLMVERQQRLLQMLRERGSAQLEDLACALEVSASTIRRDLELFEKQGYVERTHGGAIYKGQPAGEVGADVLSGQSHVALAERMNEQVEAKLAIGRHAASLVQPQMTLLLDGGSTVVYAARLITARPIQIVTNSLSIANLFAEDDQVELLVVGGNLYPRTGILMGPITTGCLADLHADLLFFSVAGIYGQEAYNQNLGMTQVEQAMMRQAAQSVLLTDSTKFGRKSLSRVCHLNELDQIVTDKAIDPQWSRQLGDRLVVSE